MKNILKDSLSKKIIDEIIEIKCSTINKLFIDLTGKRMSYRSEKIKNNWNLSRKRYNEIPLYIHSLAYEISNVSLRDKFLRKAIDQYEEPINEKYIIARVSKL